MKTTVFTPRGVCSERITIVTENDTIMQVLFEGGCDGNLQGISKLVEGRKVADVIAQVKGIDCGGKGTSCPDQLARALEALSANASET